MTRTRRMESVRRGLDRVTGAFGAPPVHRELERDAAHAWSVVTRDVTHEPASGLRGLWRRLRALFDGVTSKLAPARRLLFIVSLVLAGIGIVRTDDNGDGEVLFLVAALAGLVLLVTLELADRVEVRDELEIARALQHDLLPGRSPDLEGWEFEFSYRTANTIGGDYYQLVPVADGRLAVAAGDASGHGIAAGLVMAIADAVLRVAVARDPTPTAVADMVDDALARTSDRRAFMTLFYGLLDLGDGRLEFLDAGHPFPLLLRADGRVEELGSGAPPLGIVRGVKARPGATRLDRGDLLVLYSDGIPEALGPDGDAFGFDRVADVVSRGGDARTVHDRLLGELERFCAGRPADDDRSVVVIRRR